MKKVVLVARLLLGLGFLVFGLNGFLDFLPKPEEMPKGEAGAYLEALMSAKYLFPIKSGVEVAAGLMLLSGIGVPLALVLVAPILINIDIFHAHLQPTDWQPGAALTVLALFLGWAYWPSFRPLFGRGKRLGSAGGT